MAGYKKGMKFRMSSFISLENGNTNNPFYTWKLSVKIGDT